MSSKTIATNGIYRWKADAMKAAHNWWWHPLQFDNVYSRSLFAVELKGCICVCSVLDCARPVYAYRPVLPEQGSQLIASQK